MPDPETGPGQAATTAPLVMVTDAAPLLVKPTGRETPTGPRVVGAPNVEPPSTEMRTRTTPPALEKRWTAWFAPTTMRGAVSPPEPPIRVAGVNAWPGARAFATPSPFGPAPATTTSPLSVVKASGWAFV